MKHQKLGLIAGGSVAALCAAAWLGSAYAITDTNFTYSAAKTGYLNLHAMAFASDGYEPMQNSWVNGITAPGGNNGCFNAGVTLPHNAVITKVQTYYNTTVSGGHSLSMYRTKLSDGSGEQIATFTSTDTSGMRKISNATLDGAKATTNTAQYWYSIGGCVADSGGATFQGVRITYTYTSAGS